MRLKNMYDYRSNEHWIKFFIFISSGDHKPILHS